MELAKLAYEYGVTDGNNPPEDGRVKTYRVQNVQDGKTVAYIRNYGDPYRDDWRIQYTPMGCSDQSGYSTSEDAFKAVKERLNAFARSLQAV